MGNIKDCIAIVISASSEKEATLTGAKLAQELTEAKVGASQDIVSSKRYGNACQKLIAGMMVLFHQGGAPSLFEGQIANVGRTVAAGYIAGMAPLTDTNPPPDARLLAISRRVFSGKTLYGLLWFSQVRTLPNPQLTKFLLGTPPRGRPPLPGENYIVVCPGESGYSRLLGQWNSAYRA